MLDEIYGRKSKYLPLTKENLGIVINDVKKQLDKVNNLIKEKENSDGNQI